MKEIPLSVTQTRSAMPNGFALVDDCDYEFLIQFAWSRNSAGYAGRLDGGKMELMHRVIAKRMALAIEGKRIDHVDRNKLNNQRNNLRVAGTAENAWNAKRREDNSSGVKGVSWDKKCNSWCARIMRNGKDVWKGRFDSLSEAAEARAKELPKWHGDFANGG